MDRETRLTTAGASRAERLALRLLQLGAIGVVLVVSIRTVFDLDRFLVPKELVLHVAVVAAGLLALRAVGRTSITWIDLLLIGFLLLGALSTVTATNRWLAIRALAVSASSIALFWVARGLREAGLDRPLLNALALAVVLAAMTSLLQAYGLRTELFAASRAPGGTLGNRNFVAHVAAFGLPLCLLAALRARRGGGYLVASAGIAIVTASVVLTRSRAAWIGSAAMVLVVFGSVIVSGPLRRDGRTLRRLAGIVIVAGGAVFAALLIPNTLRWRSDNPYLESVVGVANYEQGSGRGRLVQYERSLRMAAAHPLLGVGPGNWPVKYPEYAAPGDPSMNPSEPGMTFNPWPSSDWMAFAAERGFPAAVLMALVFLGIAVVSFRRLVVARDLEEALLSAALLATVVAALVVGMLDAVLLLAVPTLLVWGTIGSAASPPAGWEPADRPAGSRRYLLIGVLAVAAVGAARSAAQLVAMEIYATHHDRASLERAARIDPGSYRLHLRLAQRCLHARAAHELFPSAEAARNLSRRCGDRKSSAPL